MNPQRTPFFAVAVALVFLAAGCRDRDEIKVYRVSKPEPETPAVASAASAPEAAPAADSEKPQVKWEVPDGWKSVPPSQMRYASFAVAGQNGETADVSVIVFPGQGGGDLENVNRWRGQIGLEPAAEADLKTLVVPVTGKSGEILTVDMTGPKAHMLAGWSRHDGRVWFFKISGPEKLVAGEKEKFAKFLRSVEFQP